MTTEQMQILPTKPFDLIMNWRALSLTCGTCGGMGRVKFLKDGKPLCQYCATNTPAPPATPKGYTVKVFYDEHQSVGFPGVVQAFEQVDLLIVNAGADPHVSDPLGGILTTRQMAERDRTVFTQAADMGLLVCVSLAGGYQQDEQGNIDPVLRLHDTTFRLATAAFGTRYD